MNAEDLYDKQAQTGLHSKYYIVNNIQKYIEVVPFSRHVQQTRDSPFPYSLKDSWIVVQRINLCKYSLEALKSDIP